MYAVNISFFFLPLSRDESRFSGSLWTCPGWNKILSLQEVAETKKHCYQRCKLQFRVTDSCCAQGLSKCVCYSGMQYYPLWELSWGLMSLSLPSGLLEFGCFCPQGRRHIALLIKILGPLRGNRFGEVQGVPDTSLKGSKTGKSRILWTLTAVERLCVSSSQNHPLAFHRAAWRLLGWACIAGFAVIQWG